MPDDRADQWGFPNPATPPGSSVYYSLRLAPPDRRDAFAALYGWRHQVRGILDQVSDPGVAQAKLRWWRDELQRTFDGTGQHPLSRRLAPLIRQSQLPPDPFLDMTEATAATLDRRWPRDLDALAATASQDLGALFELIGRAGGDQDPAQIGQARRLGAYVALVGQVRDSGWLLRRERYGCVPANRLAALGLTPTDLLAPATRHHLPPLLAEVAIQARRLRGERGDMGGLPLTLRIRVRLQDLLLAELEASGFDLADQRIALTPMRKLWHAWREARRPEA